MVGYFAMSTPLTNRQFFFHPAASGPGVTQGENRNAQVQNHEDERESNRPGAAPVEVAPHDAEAAAKEVVITDIGDLLHRHEVIDEEGRSFKDLDGTDAAITVLERNDLKDIPARAKELCQADAAIDITAHGQWIKENALYLALDVATYHQDYKVAEMKQLLKVLTDVFEPKS